MAQNVFSDGLVRKTDSHVPGGYPETDIARFWSHVDRGDGCWLWGLRPNGRYGMFKVGSRPDRRSIRAHRFAWEITNGAIPVGKMVLHRCDVPLCVRPDHLFLGTALDNAQDRERKGRGNQPKGARNNRAILSEGQVRELRAAHEDGVTVARLARLVGISEEHVRRILNRGSWDHLT